MPNGTIPGEPELPRPLPAVPLFLIILVIIASVLGAVFWRPLFLAGPPVFLLIAYAYIAMRRWGYEVRYVLEGTEDGAARDVWILLMFSCAVAWVFMALGAPLWKSFLALLFCVLTAALLPWPVHIAFQIGTRVIPLIIAALILAALIVIPAFVFDLTPAGLVCYVLGVLLAAGSAAASLWAGSRISIKFYANEKAPREDMLVKLSAVTIPGLLLGLDAMFFAVLVL